MAGLYRYTAVSIEGGGAGGVRRGELSAESAADLRASLRRVGLRVTDMREVRRTGTLSFGPLRALLDGQLRRRRQPAKAELFDSLATMLDAGLPIVEALTSLVHSRSRSSRRALVSELRERLRAGDAVADAAQARADWFDEAEVAMLRVGEASGELPTVMRALAVRHQRGGELSAKLVGALAYPVVVGCVGLGVVVFLSVKTLPELVSILDSSGLETPALTSAIMALGDLLRHWGPLLMLGLLAAMIGLALLPRWLEAHGIAVSKWTDRMTPTAFKRVSLARAASALSELLGAGVTLVEALRITGPTLGGPSGTLLGRTLVAVADRVERGERLSEALESSHYFDDEVCRLVEIGETSGELRDILSRLAEREARRADRAIDRLATMLEPAVILALAGMVGLVVMGAIMPLMRLQEVIR